MNPEPLRPPGPGSRAHDHWWLVCWNQIKVGYTGTNLVLGDHLVHFTTLWNKHLGAGTTLVCYPGHESRPGGLLAGAVVWLLWLWVLKIAGCDCVSMTKQ